MGARRPEGQRRAGRDVHAGRGGGRCRAGRSRRRSGALSGTARVRVMPPLPLDDELRRLHRRGAAGRLDQRDRQVRRERPRGQQVLQRREDNTLSRRARLFFGTAGHGRLHGGDGRAHRGAAPPAGRRRRHRAALRRSILFGNSQKVELQPWQPVVKMTASAPFQWKADTWYRVKVEVQNLKDGNDARARQGVAARRSRARRSGWSRRSTRSATSSGSPGSMPTRSSGRIYDNIKVTRTRVVVRATGY